MPNVELTKILVTKRPLWQELDTLCTALANPIRRRSLPAETIVRFSSLYRAACADLALADAYHLPPETVRYLHQLVGRAHNQLYRAKSFNVRAWFVELFVKLPSLLASDRIVWLAFALFFGVFFLSAFGAFVSPEFALEAVGAEQLDAIESSFSAPPRGRDFTIDVGMAGFYVFNNATIGLRCFVFGLFWGVGGLYETMFNAVVLGATFGHMTASQNAKHFFEFVAAHSVFELTAVVLSAAAGMRLGFALVFTQGYSRTDSLRIAGRRAMPTVGLAVLLFVGAAMIEAFISPADVSPLLKTAVGAGTAAMLAAYLILPRWLGNSAVDRVE